VSAGLCYVLHEPQLQRCVPPCAVQAVLAFVTCLHSPEPLCRAALDLLMLLHTRLDLLAPPTDDIVTSTAGAITMPDGTRHPSIPHKTSGFRIHIVIPLLYVETSRFSSFTYVSVLAAAAWVSSWGCTLEALATAARDPRLGVRCHALSLLTEALLDKQSTYLNTLNWVDCMALMWLLG
jgi:hypothetical protein